MRSEVDAGTVTVPRVGAALLSKWPGPLINADGEAGGAPGPRGGGVLLERWPARLINAEGGGGGPPSGNRALFLNDCPAASCSSRELNGTPRLLSSVRASAWVPPKGALMRNPPPLSTT